jgi:hypothetical protein
MFLRLNMKKKRRKIDKFIEQVFQIGGGWGWLQTAKLRSRLDYILRGWLPPPEFKVTKYSLEGTYV